MKEESTIRVRKRSQFNHKNIQNWDDFKATWKQISFKESLNTLDERALILFWEQELTLLSEETEKISILVPLMVNKTQPQPTENKEIDKIHQQPLIQEKQREAGEKQNETVEKKTPKQEKQPAKNNKKIGQRKQASNQVKLDRKVVQIAMNLVNEKFQNLQYAYDSLFMGNEKQLLIYRSCSSMNRYLCKYRLPNHFKPKLDQFNKLADEFYEVKRKCNLYISTFSIKSRNELLRELNSLKQDINKQLEDFRIYFKPILQDFTSNKKATLITMQAVRSEMIPMIESLCKQCQLQAKNKYFQTDYDQVRDIQITKPSQQEIQPLEQDQSQKAEVIRYIYVDAPKQPETPKDIYNVTLISINLKNQSWVWRLSMPKCGSHNQVKGIYLRAPEGEGPSQLALQVATDVMQVEIQLYPYKVGKVVWDIYLWNDVGFTKSAQRMVVYNELEVRNNSKPLQNYKITLLGMSDCGINLEHQNFKTVQNCKQISIYNGAVICDAQGTVGGWGQMYYPQDNQTQENTSAVDISLALFNNQRIESPFLVLKNQFIRKVSCGMGYTLMLSSLGVIWSFGFNGYGQLGQGHFESNVYTTEPKQICKFTGQTSTFVTDICASTKGSSFALGDDGRVYRWGYNQVDETNYPVYDRFGTVINYQTKQLVYKNSNPISIPRGIITGQATTIQACNEHYFALSKEGDLYGWGMAAMLGLGELKDTKEEQIEEFVLPICVMSQVDFVSTSFYHTIVVTRSGRIMAWGKANLFSNKLQGQFKKPIDITNEYMPQNSKKIKIIKAGVSYTVVVRQDNTIELIGTQALLKIDSQDFKTIFDVTCSKFQECLALLTHN